MKEYTANKIFYTVGVIFCIMVGIMFVTYTPAEKVEPTPNEKITMTVDEFVSLPGDFYYIVKDTGSWGVLESDVYMDREVVEIAVCDDTENTICLFIQLEENEEPHYRKVY